MPTLSVVTPEGIELRTEIAGAGSRAAAAVLDLVLLIAGELVLLLAAYAVAAIASEAGARVIEEVSDFLVGLIGGGMLLSIPVYFAVAPVLMSGCTPGKRMLGLRVVAASGYGATTGQHVLRALLWVVDALLMLPAPLGLMLIAATPQGRRLGDLAAGTLVVHESRRAHREELWPGETWSAREVQHLALTPGMAARLDEADMELLRDAIERREMPRDLRDSLYRDLATHYAELLGVEPAQNPRTSLKELYLFGREFRGAS